MQIRLNDQVQVRRGEHRGKFGKVTAFLRNDDDSAVVFIRHNGVTIWPHIARCDLIVLGQPHPSCR